MDFYKMIGQHYDQLFPTNEAQLMFLKRGLEEESSILDIGCATGTYAIPLARCGYHVTAFDLDELMVNEMLSKANEAELTIKGFVLNMERLDEVNAGQFNLIYCIGNTLVHLETKEALITFFEQAYHKLKQGGRLVVQIVNYDRMIKKGITELPVIDRPEVGITFQRKYHHEGDHVLFRGLLDFKTGEHFEAETRLMCLEKSTLESAITQAGITQWSVYGAFDFSDWHDESLATIVSITK